IRPDLLISENGLSVTELDSVPGGIGLTAWLNQTYSSLPGASGSPSDQNVGSHGLANGNVSVIGGSDGMLRGFESIFDGASTVHIVISEEAATYRPEMAWVANQLGTDKFKIQTAEFSDIRDSEAVYRFFELFDLANVSNSTKIFELAASGRIRVTPPPKPVFEEKMLFALLWNRHLHEFWRQELGERFFNRMLRLVPYTWLVDPSPLPPQAAIPELNLTNWQQLKALSQKEREFILKLSAFPP